MLRPACSHRLTGAGWRLGGSYCVCLRSPVAGGREVWVMPAEQQDLLDSRRRQILASLIAWCNAHYDEQAGLALSGDRHGHVIGNVQYAVALAEAAAGNLDAGLPAAAARARAVSILTRLFAGI